MADIHNIAQTSGDDYEEITSEEVDRVIAGLEAMMGQTKSENIRAYLEEAADPTLGPSQIVGHGNFQLRRELPQPQAGARPSAF